MRHTRVHNKDIVENMLYFYSFAMRYLDGGKLGGIRVSAKKQLLNYQSNAFGKD